MIQTLNDATFSSFIGSGFYVMVGFYHANAAEKQQMFDVMEQFHESHASVAAGYLDISKNKSAEDYGITEDIGPVIVIFKQGNPFKAFGKDNFSVEALSTAIAPPGKNITLQ